jgi:Ni/Co efflux regulator RcnB
MSATIAAAACAPRRAAIAGSAWTTNYVLAAVATGLIASVIIANH